MITVHRWIAMTAGAVGVTLSVESADLPLSLGTTYGGVIAEAGEVHRYVFPGAPGKRLYYDALEGDFDPIGVVLQNPLGQAAFINGNADSDVGPFLLGATGQYRLTFSGQGDATGDYKFRLLDLDGAPPLPIGSTFETQLGSRTECQVFQFPGIVGQRLRFESVRADGSSAATWALISPHGTTLATASLSSGLGDLTLPFDGPYFLMICGGGTSATPLLYAIRATDITDAPVAVSGLDLEFTGTLNGIETNLYTFTASAGLPLFFDARDASQTVAVDVIAPAGGVVFSIGNGNDSGPYRLPRSGTYTVRVRGVAGGTSNYRFRLLNLNAAPLLSFDSATTATLAARQTDVYRVSAGAGKRLLYDALEADFDPVSVTLLAPDGTTLLSGNADSDSSVLNTVANGTYYLIIQSAVDGNADYAFRMIDVLAQSVLPLEQNVSGTLSPGYAAKVFVVSGPAGQQLFFNSLMDPGGNNYWYFFDAFNRNLGVTHLRDDLAFITPLAGDSVLVLSGGDANPVNYSFRAVTFEISTEALTLGTTMTGAIGEPGEQHRYTFTGTVGQRLYYDALDGDFDPINARLYDPFGQLVFINGNADYDVGPFTLTQPGLYTLRIEADGDRTGDFGFRLLDISTQSVLPLDQNVSGTLSPGYAAKVFVVSGPAGQQLFFNSLMDPGGNNYWYFFDAFNRNLGVTHLRDDLAFITPLAGDSVLVLSGGDANPVNYSFRAVTFEISTQALTLGTTMTGAIGEPGEQHRYTFTGTAGQRLYYDALDGDFDPINARLYDPFGQLVFINGNADSDVGPFTLTQPGLYTLRIEADGDRTGDFGFRLLDISTQSVLPLDQNVSGTLSPGYAAKVFVVSGPAGQQLFFDSLMDPGGNNYWYFFDAFNRNLGVTHLRVDLAFITPLAGDSVLVLSGGDANPVNYSFRAVTFEISTEALTLGTTMTGAIGEPGEQHRYTFTGTAGQRLYYDALDGDFDPINARLYDPFGQLVFINGNADSDVGPFTLTQPGLYTLRIEADGDRTGDFSFRLVDLASVPAYAVGTSLTGALNPSIETDIAQFLGTRGQRLNLDSVAASSGQANWFLVTPTDQILTSGNILSDLGSILLPSAGQYLLLVRGENPGGASLSYEVHLQDTSDSPVVPAGLGDLMTGMIAAGQEVQFTFDAPAGERLFFDSQEPQASAILVDIRSPSDALLLSLPANADSGPHVLPQSGTYTVKIHGNMPSATGPYRFRILDLTSGVPLLDLNTRVTEAALASDEIKFYRLDLQAGQRLYYDALEGDYQSVAVRSFDPNGVSGLFNANADSDVGPVTAPFSGTFWLAFQNNSSSVSHYDFRLLDVGAQPMLPLDLLVNGSLDPGWSAQLYRLDGIKGQTFFFDSRNAAGGGSWTLYAPNNAQVAGGGQVNGDFQHTLSVDGTHVLVINSFSGGPVPLSWEAVTFGVQSQALVLGATETGQISEPGERHVFTFQGTTGQRLYYDALDGDYDPIVVTLLDPAGRVVHLNGNADTDVGPYTLNDTGTFRLVIASSGDTTADFGFRLLDVGAQPMLPLDLVVNGSLDPGWSAQLYRLEGIKGQTFFFDSRNAAGGGSWTLYAPNNAGVAGGGQVNGDFQHTLSADGTYVLVLSGNFGTPVPFSFVVVTPNEAATFPANRGPNLEAIDPQEIGEQKELTFPVLATDPDVGDTLSYSIDPGGPAGAAIDSTTGVFRWTPPFTGFSYFTNLTIRVSDSGQPSLSQAQIIAIKVISGPILIGLNKGPSSALVTWRSAPGETYRLQYRETLSGGQWKDVSGIDLQAAGFTTSETDPTTGADPERFYRVLFFPRP